MKVFISGGCKNGKSFFAQHLAKETCAMKKTGSLYYIATMKPADKEDDERIVRHRQEREGWGFITIEQQTDIEKILAKCEHDSVFLLDSLTALLANEMFLPDGTVNMNAAEKVASGLIEIVSQIDDIVIISDYIYGDGQIYDNLTEHYRKSLAQIDRVAAGQSDIVLEIAFSNVIVHKGRELFDYKLHDRTHS